MYRITNEMRFPLSKDTNLFTHLPRRRFSWQGHYPYETQSHTLCCHKTDVFVGNNSQKNDARGPVVGELSSSLKRRNSDDALTKYFRSWTSSGNWIDIDDSLRSFFLFLFYFFVTFFNRLRETVGSFKANGRKILILH